MSRLPIDIINFNDEFNSELNLAIAISNGIQNEFIFTLAPQEISKKFHILNFEEIDGNEFLSKANEIKADLKGFYPHLLFFTNSPIKSDGWSNLFADSDYAIGISIVTTNNVADKIIPREKMAAYFVYYLARTGIKFILKNRTNHEKPSKKGCLFDFMEEKSDITKSMRANAICDECRRDLLKEQHFVSENQMSAVDILLAKSGTLLKDGNKIESKTRKIFIGSSKEGLDVARKIKASLKYDAHVDTWADGLFDKPGQAYIEVIENILANYEYGIFVFTPDDEIFSRGKYSKIPRDNVIFEYGMFLGKHTREKAFFIVPRGIDIKIMTDVLGITSLDYDSTNTNLQSAVSDACDQIRTIIKEGI